MILEEVTLIVGGQRLAGFQEVNVTRSAESPEIAFALKATNPSWHPHAFALRVGVDVALYAGSDLLVTGDIDTYEADHGERETHEVRVSGRSKGARCVDCPPAKHKTGRVENQDLLGVAKEFDEFGIGFSADVPLERLAKVQRRPTDTAFQTLEREARKAGVLLTGQPDGTVKITRAGTKRHAGALSEGLPPLKALKLRYSNAEKFSPIVARGQRVEGTDAGSLRQEVQEYDPSVGRYRPVILFVEGDASEKTLKRRAAWQRLRDAGNGISATATLASWRDADGLLWDPPRLVAVQFPSERLDQDLALSTVTFTQDIQGTRAVLTLVDPRTLGGKNGAKSKSDKAYDTKQGDLE